MPFFFCSSVTRFSKLLEQISPATTIFPLERPIASGLKARMDSASRKKTRFDDENDEMLLK